MTHNPFQIDGMLPVQAAPHVVARLRRWVDDGGTALDIAPVAPSTGLPGQVALQVLLAAEREIRARGATPDLSEAARAICAMTASDGVSASSERSAS